MGYVMSQSCSHSCTLYVWPRCAACHNDCGVAASDSDCGRAASLDDCGVAAGDGDCGCAASHNDCGVAAGDGDCGVAAGDGDCGVAASHNDCGVAAGDGDCGVAAGDGDCGVAAVESDRIVFMTMTNGHLNDNMRSCCDIILQRSKECCFVGFHNLTFAQTSKKQQMRPHVSRTLGSGPTRVLVISQYHQTKKYINKNINKKIGQK